ncbi:MAG TPA: hypothetical protein VGN76_03640 [Gemmatimonadales bacterium]|jgi:hypothetical protein|nr:hypothetical protein [Gemmatimonadales bacterium]
MCSPLSRPTPFDLVFHSAAETTFPTIRSALDQAGQDPRDRDRFLMLREVVTLLREMRPDEGLGEGIDRLAALVHHAYLFWDGGALTLEFPLERLGDRLDSGSAQDRNETTGPAYYAQVPERRIWAQVIPGEPHEPMDGCFVHDLSGSAELRVLGVFGIHPDRTGFSVVEVTGPAPGALHRLDGSDLFAPTLAGGAAAKLFSIAGEEELLELGWRSHEAATRAAAEGLRWKA